MFLARTNNRRKREEARGSAMNMEEYAEGDGEKAL